MSGPSREPHKKPHRYCCEHDHERGRVILAVLVKVVLLVVSAENFIRQGSTTIPASLHSGAQPWPLDESAASLHVAPNVGFFASHSWTRQQVLALGSRAPAADITVFDAETIADRATYTDPHQYAVGIRHVIVNGVPISRNGALTGEKPGRVLRGPARHLSLRK